MQQNECFFVRRHFQAETSATWIKKIGYWFSRSTVVRSVFLRVRYTPLNDIICVSFFPKGNCHSAVHLSRTFNECLCVWVADDGISPRRDEIVMCILAFWLEESRFFSSEAADSLWRLPLAGLRTHPIKAYIK